MILFNEKINSFERPKSVGYVFTGNSIIERNGKVNYLSINSLPEFSNLSFEELKFVDCDINKAQSQFKENHFVQFNSQENRKLFTNFSTEESEVPKREENINENIEIKESNIMDNENNNSEDNEFKSKNNNIYDDTSNNLVINMNKIKNNKINIEINDDNINILVNKIIKVDINSSTNSLSINKNNININSNGDKLIVKTNNNINNNFNNFSPKNKINEESILTKNNTNYSSIGNSYNRKTCDNIFSLINIEKRNLNQEEKEDDKLGVNKDLNYSKDNTKNIKNIFQGKFPRLNIIKNSSKFLYKKQLIKKSKPSNLNEESNNKNLLKINCHIIKPYKVSFSLEINKDIQISELKKLIVEELIKRENNFLSFKNNTFYLMKDYTFIKETGNIDEANLFNEDDLYIAFKNDKE